MLDKSFKAIASAFFIEQKNADRFLGKGIYQGAIPGMFAHARPPLQFLDPTEYTDMQRKQRAQYFGIGMLISMDGAKVTRWRPFPVRRGERARRPARGDVMVAVVVGVSGKDGSAKGFSGCCRVCLRRTARNSGARSTVTRGRRSERGDRDS